MLFFFELFLFVLVMLTLALGEFVSRWLALVLWLVVTGFALAGYLLARWALSDAIAAGDAQPPDPPADEGESHGSPVSSEATPDAAAELHTGPPVDVPADAPGDAPPTALDVRWARTLLYNWRRSNVLLVLGAAAVAVWYWLGR
ncbi:MAG: hypothetical protein U0893_07920 [Chloroflexota bacterium]